MYLEISFRGRGQGGGPIGETWFVSWCCQLMSWMMVRIWKDYRPPLICGPSAEVKRWTETERKGPGSWARRLPDSCGPCEQLICFRLVWMCARKDSARPWWMHFGALMANWLLEALSPGQARVTSGGIQMSCRCLVSNGRWGTRGWRQETIAFGSILWQINRWDYKYGGR